MYFIVVYGQKMSHFRAIRCSVHTVSYRGSPRLHRMNRRQIRVPPPSPDRLHTHLNREASFPRTDPVEPTPTGEKMHLQHVYCCRSGGFPSLGSPLSVVARPRRALSARPRPSREWRARLDARRVRRMGGGGMHGHSTANGHYDRTEWIF